MAQSARHSFFVHPGAEPIRSRLLLTVKKAATGDGLVSIGTIEGSGIKGIAATKSNIVGNGIDLTGHLGGLTVRDIRAGAVGNASGTATTRTTIITHIVDAM